jgi:hypothetical protein
MIITAGSPGLPLPAPRTAGGKRQQWSRAMTYGLDRRVPDEPAPRARRIGFGAWRSLDSQSRLLMVERELKPANDLIDEYPVAL